MIDEFINRLLEHGVIEIRALSVQREDYPEVGRFQKTLSGYFNNLTALKQNIQAINGKARGIYMCVNPVSDAFLGRGNNVLRDSKDATADKEISSRKWLIFDFDSIRPVGVMATEEEIEKTLVITNQFITDRKLENWGEPSIIFSGSGYHLYYRYDADLSDREISEMYLKYDNTYDGFDSVVKNLARIMRVPSTWNCKGDPLPEQNRVYRKCEIIQLGDTTPVPLKSISDDVSYEELSNIIAPIDTEFNTPISIQRNKTDWVQLFKDQNMCNSDLNAGKVNVLCPNREAHSVDSDWSNSTSLLLTDKGSQVFKCQHNSCQTINTNWLINHFSMDVVSQYSTLDIVESAKLTRDSNIAKMNDMYSAVDDNGKFVVIKKTYNSILGYYELRRYQVKDFLALTMSKKVITEVNGKTKSVPIGSYWLSHDDRLQYNEIGFYPAHGAPEGMFNTWMGYNYVPKAGDCSLYIDHIKTIITNGNSEYYNYLMDWMAHSLQFPLKKPDVSIILMGGQGTGKGAFVNHFGKLFGKHFETVTNADHLLGQFSEHISESTLIFADEAFWAGDKKTDGILKDLITGNIRLMEGKFKTAVKIASFCRIIMSSNKDWVVPAEHDDRRYFILKVLALQMSFKEVSIYYSAMEKQMNNGGYEALFDLLLKRDLSKFVPYDCPKTEGLLRNKMMSLSNVAGWIYNRIKYEMLDPWDVDEVYSNYCTTLGSGHKFDKNKFESMLTSILPHAKTKKIEEASGINFKWDFGSLTQCREAFDIYMRQPVKWNN